MHENKICVIDDNASVCHSLGFLFNSYCNAGIKTYLNPALFLDECSPDWKGCIITDLLMPSLNGMDFIKELKRRACKMHIIMLTGHVSKSLAAQSLAAGADVFIYKPFNVEHLLNNVHAILKSS